MPWPNVAYRRRQLRKCAPERETARQSSLAACTPGGRDSPKFQAVCDAFVAHYDKHSNDHTAPYPGVMDLLRQCQAAGITMGIVSNKLDWAVNQLGDRTFPG